MCKECNQSYDEFVQFMKKAPHNLPITAKGMTKGGALSNNVHNESKDIAHYKQQKTPQDFTLER